MTTLYLRYELACIRPVTSHLNCVNAAAWCCDLLTLAAGLSAEGRLPAGYLRRVVSRGAHHRCHHVVNCHMGAGLCTERPQVSAFDAFRRRPGNRLHTLGWQHVHKSTPVTTVCAPGQVASNRNRDAGSTVLRSVCLPRCMHARVQRASGMALYPRPPTNARLTSRTPCASSVPRGP